MVSNKKNNKEERVGFNLSQFFNKKLEFKNNKIFFGSNVQVKDISKIIKVNIDKIYKLLKIEKNENYILDQDQTAEIALNNNMDFEHIDDVSEENVMNKINYLIKNFNWDERVEYVSRTPIVTIMGHVDHGKTTLLDTIRKTNITKKEVGGITQKIGAYQIEYNSKKITFIDTPGHESFSEMRANGSKVTDIAIIVVSVDDSIMPQTRESIEHALAAKVPIIIALNKIDKNGKNIDNIKNSMLELGVVSEDLGGNVPFVEISALKNINIDLLLETIIATSELIDLKVPLNVFASGTVIESNISKKNGYLVSVIIKNGTLRVGDNIVIDDRLIRVKAIIDSNGERLFSAFPGMPVELHGIGFTPLVGSNFVVTNDKNAIKVVNTIKENKLHAINKRKNISPLDIFSQINQNKKKINIILKTDSYGSLITIASQIERYSNDQFDVKVIRKDIGDITNTDINLATSSNAIIYLFNLNIPSNLRQQIKNRNIIVLSFDIIYELFDDIESKINSKKEDVLEEVKIGRFEVLAKFESSKLGQIAGGIVRDGSVKNNSKVIVYRNNKNIFEDKIISLKIKQSDVKEVKKGKECGIILENFKEFQEGDNFEIFDFVSSKKNK